MDMHLYRIKEAIRLFHETSALVCQSFHVWALDRLTGSVIDAGDLGAPVGSRRGHRNRTHPSP
jgi:hypothetical protein